MIKWIKRFFTDETAFVGFVRACCIGFGTAAATGHLPIPEDWNVVGVIAAGLGGFIRAGDKNKPDA